MAGPGKGDPPGASRRGRARGNRWNSYRRALFLDRLSERCNVAAAARYAGMDRSSAYNLKDRDPEFAWAWQQALERSHADLEWSLLGAAMKGSIRTEVTFDGETRKPKQIKLTRTEPHQLGLRLFLAHRAEVDAFRAASGVAGGMSDDDVRARIEDIRAKLLTHLAEKRRPTPSESRDDDEQG